MANVVFKFAAPPGYTPTVKIYRADTVVLLGQDTAAELTADGHYSVTIDVGSYTGNVLATLTNPDGSLYGSTLDGQLRSDPSELAAIEAAIAEFELPTEQIAAIALAVYRRLAGGSVGLLAGPTSDGPLDVVHSADFDYTFDAEVAADSTRVFTIRRDVADSEPALDIIDASIESLNGSAPTNAADGFIERLSSTSCRVWIRARTLQLLAPGEYVAEFREITVSDETKDILELALSVRRSPSRRVAE